jgi:hypothetical protein
MTTPRVTTFVLTLALGLALGCDRQTTSPDAGGGPCDDFELDVERIWGSSKRREVRDGLRSFAGESQVMNVDRIVTKMDAITSDWVMMSRRACRDTVERRTMPEEI